MANTARTIGEFPHLLSFIMAGKKVGAVFTSHLPAATATFRVMATVACAAFALNMFYLKTVFPTQEQLEHYKAEMAQAYGNLPRAVEQLTNIAAEQKKWNEARQDLPRRVEYLDEMAKVSREDRTELHKAIAQHDREISASDKQLAVVQTQISEMLRQVVETNRRLEKIGDKLGVP